MIAYVTGILGAGKSYYGARKIAEALLKGRQVAANMALLPGWEKIVLSHAHYYRFAKSDQREQYEAEIRSRYAFIPDIEVLISARLHGKGEGRGLRVIDEAHNEVNNRAWLETNQKVVLKKMALARKRGWDDLILAQHKDNTDMALRRIAGVEIRLINWREILQLPFFQTKILPKPLFLAQAFPMNVPKNIRRESKRLWAELYLLGWQKAIYDTFEDFDAGVEEDFAEDVLWLPIPGGYNHLEFLEERATRRATLSTSDGEPSTTSWEAWKASLRGGLPAESLPQASPSHADRTPTPPAPLPTYESEERDS